MTDGNKVAWPSELSASMTGSVVKIGTLTQNPSIMIFDNQGTVAVAVSVNDSTGSSVWRTFPGGEALTLDFKTNKGVADTWSPSIGDTFYGNGASGGTFSISYLYAKS